VNVERGRVVRIVPERRAGKLRRFGKVAGAKLRRGKPDQFARGDCVIDAIAPADAKA